MTVIPESSFLSLAAKLLQARTHQSIWKFLKLLKQQLYDQLSKFFHTISHKRNAWEWLSGVVTLPKTPVAGGARFA